MVLKIKGIPNIFGDERGNTEGFGKIPRGQFDWSAHGSIFQPANQDAGDPNFDDVYYGIGGIEAAGGNFTAFCQVILPHGVTVISVDVIGVGGGEDFWLKRLKDDGTVSTMATGTFNTTEISITNPLIDNNQYSYFVQTGAVADNIRKVRITYDQ